MRLVWCRKTRLACTEERGVGMGTRFPCETAFDLVESALLLAASLLLILFSPKLYRSLPNDSHRDGEFCKIELKPIIVVIALITEQLKLIVLKYKNNKNK